MSDLNQTYQRHVPRLLIEGAIDAAEDTAEWVALWTQIGKYVYFQIHRKRVEVTRLASTLNQLAAHRAVTHPLSRRWTMGDQIQALNRD